MSIVDKEQLIGGELQIGQHLGGSEFGDVLLVGEVGLLDATVVRDILAKCALTIKLIIELKKIVR